MVLTVCVLLVACTLGVGVMVVDLFMIVFVDDCCGRFCSVEDIVLVVEFVSVAFDWLLRISSIFSNAFQFVLSLSGSSFL